MERRFAIAAAHNFCEKETCEKGDVVLWHNALSISQ